jgi:hypothetical protein
LHGRTATRSPRRCGTRAGAVAVAGALGVEVGEADQVELQEVTQFGEPRPCGRRGTGPDRCRSADLEAAAATLTFAIVGGSDGTASGYSVIVPGVASAAVKPSDPRRNQPIKRAELAVDPPPDRALGSFAPGRFCGFVRRPIVRCDPETGVSRVVRRVRDRRCVVSHPYTLRLEARYEAR